jgi:hypothetical protein
MLDTDGFLDDVGEVHGFGLERNETDGKRSIGLTATGFANVVCCLAA